MKKYLFSLLSVIASFQCLAQTDQIPLLNQRFIHQFNWVEDENNYYFLTLSYGSSTNYLLTTTHAVEYTIHKYDKLSYQHINSQVIAGDTTQADSVIYIFGPTMQVKEGRIHFVYTKQIPVGNSNHGHLYYTQLDTNLNLIVTERRLEDDALLQGFIPFNSHKTLVYFLKGDSMLMPGSQFSKYQVIDEIGNVIKEDTFEKKPIFMQGGILSHQIAEVVPYGTDKYLVSGNDVLGNNTGKGFYLSDSNLNLIDTFLLKPVFFNSGSYSNGYFPRFPNMVCLPTGSIVSGGLYSVGNIYSILTKHQATSRFNIDTSVVYDGIDQNDMKHSNMPALHCLEYNEYDNRIYYADATHKDPFTSCTGNYNYIQIISADTNLHTQWRIFILHGPDSCAQVTKVSKPYGRSGVLVAGTAFNTSHPSDTAYVSHFVYYIDSSGSPLSVVGGEGVTVRKRIVVFPNPAHDFVTVSDIEGALREVVIYNSVGSIVSVKALTGREARIDISDLAAGLYLVKVRTADDEYIQVKLLKE